MKILLILFFVSCTLTTSFSQDPGTTTNNRHEVAVDATPLLRQFLNLNGQNQVPNPYFLMYRYHFNDWAIRARAGGYVNSINEVTHDTLIQKSEITSFEFRLGIERKMDFAKRWQFFYGLDLMAATERVLNKTQFRPAETNTYDKHTKTYGASPMVGFRFKINNHISITTETNFLIYYYEGYYNRLFTPNDHLNVETDLDGARMQYNAPTSLYFTYAF